MNALAGLFAILAQTPADRGDQARSALILWILFAAGGIVFVGAVWAILSSLRKRREARARDARKRPKPIKDAWDESARRLEVEPPDDPEDDDLRVDR